MMVNTPLCNRLYLFLFFMPSLHPSYFFRFFLLLPVSTLFMEHELRSTPRYSYFNFLVQLLIELAAICI